VVGIKGEEFEGQRGIGRGFSVAVVAISLFFGARGTGVDLR